jgi:hypothetical protein
MRRVGYILMAVGWLGIVAGFGSVAYALMTGNFGKSAEELATHTVPVGDPDGNPRIFIVAERFFVFVGSGIIVFGIGGCLRDAKKAGGHHVA